MQYKKYQYIKSSMGSFVRPLYFGTNEGWENFNYLNDNFKITKITSEQYKVFKKCSVNGHQAIENHFLIVLDTYLSKYTKKYKPTQDYWPGRYSMEKFKSLIDDAIINRKN